MSESAPDSATPRELGPFGRLVAVLRQPLGGLIAVALLALLPLIWAMRPPNTPMAPPPPILSRLPDFELVDQDGATFGTQQLRGKPWVGGVFFTRCPTVCPALIKELRGLELDTRPAAPGARFVAFSADASHDSPAVLKDYAAGSGLEGERWVLLTGEEKEVRAAVLEGLKLGLGEDGEAPFGIFHATHVVLVDSALNVRGYYRSDSEEELDQLVRDLIALERLRS